MMIWSKPYGFYGIMIVGRRVNINSLKMGIMSFKSKISGILLSAVLIATPSLVNAETLDFTQASFIGTNGNVAGTTYSITSSGTLTWTQGQDGSTCTGLACVRDGIGVGDDEITIGSEYIRVDFGQAVRITSLAFLDLFSSSSGNNRERAVVTYGSGSMFFDSLLSETPGDDSGFLAAYGLDIVTNFLTFTADGTNDNLGRDDYALAAIGVSPVPLPPALLMFGAALGGIGFLGFKRNKKRNNPF